jgi:hypothetical protein
MTEKSTVSFLEGRISKAQAKGKGKFDSKLRNEAQRVLEDCRYKINLVEHGLDVSGKRDDRLEQVKAALGELGLALHLTKLSK